MDNVIKVLIIGAPQAGKSCVANFCASRIDAITSAYRPTVGVRVLKCVKNIVHDTAPEGEKIEVHFWDLSGDPKYENCWLAAKKDVDGVVLVVNGDLRVMNEDIEGLIKNFPKEMGLKPVSCLGLEHHPSGFIRQDMTDTSHCGLQFYHSVVEDGKKTIAPHLDKFLSRVANKKVAELAALEREGGEANEY